MKYSVGLYIKPEAKFIYKLGKQMLTEIPYSLFNAFKSIKISITDIQSVNKEIRDIW